ncbi:MAG: ScaI family restriction endonuclease [Rubrobacter sp.]|nr:ScaI family restriction endonuclease [Rubrobacter sp.]
MPSPYKDIPHDEWQEVTRQLVEKHPLKLDVIRKVAVQCWVTLWHTSIGEGETAIPLADIDVPATVIGYFFERLFGRELELKFPGLWRGGRSKDEKDLVCLTDAAYSIEMKSSGQLGTKIFGNRSYNQRAKDEGHVVKAEKSGYYITVNFYGQALTLLRFGWIDLDDWKPQGAQTGQAATLPSYVYDLKLVEIPGSYRLASPVGLLSGGGPSKVESFAREGVETVGQLLDYQGSDRTISKFKEQAAQYGQTSSKSERA